MNRILVRYFLVVGVLVWSMLPSLATLAVHSEAVELRSVDAHSTKQQHAQASDDATHFQPLVVDAEFDGFVETFTEQEEKPDTEFDFAFPDVISGLGHHERFCLCWLAGYDATILLPSEYFHYFPNQSRYVLFAVFRL